MSRIVIILSIFALIFSCNEKAIMPPEKPVVLPLRLKHKINGDSIQVGSPISFNFPIKSKGKSFFLIWSNTFRDVLIEGLDGAKGLHFKVPHELTLKSGDVNLYLYKEDEKIDELKIHLKPLEASGNLFSSIGPSALLLDQDRKTMMTLIPRDEYFNPLPDGSLSSLYYKYPNTSQVQERLSSKDFIASKIFASKEQKGKLFLGAKADKAYANEEEVSLEPGAPTNFKIQVLEHYPFAEARQNLIIRSSAIKDEFGNLIADGTMVQFKLSNSSAGLSIYQAIVIDGIATLEMLNPKEPGLYDIQAAIHQTAISNILTLGFRRAVHNIPLSVNDQNELTIGPVHGSLNQLIPDGTFGKLIIGERNIELEFVKGIATWSFPLDLVIRQQEEWQIKILGIIESFNPSKLIDEE